MSEQEQITTNTVVEQPTFTENNDGMPVPVQKTENVANDTTDANQEVDTQQDVQPENVDSKDGVEDADKDIPPEETVQLNKAEYKKLKEYELIEAERRALQERLGLQDVNPQDFNYQTLDQQVINRGQQELLRLCNEYGVSSNPDEFEGSINKLKETNPQKGFELERKVEQLMNNVGNKRNEIAYQASQTQIQQFATENHDILSVSPVLNRILTEYAQANAGNPNIYDNLNTINSYLLDVYREGLEYGQRIASLEKAKSDTSKVQGGIVNAPQSGYAGEPHIFTRAELKTMSADEFAKNEKIIEEQMKKGLIV